MSQPDPRVLEPQNPGEDLFTAEEWIAINEILRLPLRELEVVMSLFEGRSVAAIASRDKISVETVRQYLKRTHERLLVNDRLGLAARVFRAYILACEDRNGSRPPIFLDEV